MGFAHFAKRIAIHIWSVGKKKLEFLCEGSCKCIFRLGIKASENSPKFSHPNSMVSQKEASTKPETFQTLVFGWLLKRPTLFF